MTVTIGNDVEFILTRGDSAVSVIGMIGGTKRDPLPCKLGALQEDNVVAEINIHPAKTRAEWERNITTVVKELQKKLPDGIKISKAASEIFSPDELAHPQAQEFGCEPDMNAWVQRENKFKKLSGELARLRSAGGHVHVGIDLKTVLDGFSLIKCMDTFIGLQAVIVDHDIRRKLLYGKAGAMRFKPYGVEWRTPSNFWVHSKAGRRWMFDSAKFCAENFLDLQSFYTLTDVPRIINSNSKEKAMRLLRKMSKSVSFPLHPELEI